MPRKKTSKKAEISAKRANYRRKTKMEQWGGNATWYEDMSSMTKPQMEKFLKNAIKQTSRRLVSLERQKIDSFAAYKLTTVLQNMPLDNLESLSRQKLASIMSAYHDFWSSKSATAQGAKEINREQDIRIFGAQEDIGGREFPIYRMTEEERRLFWATYMEFFKQNKDVIEGKDNSERIQRLIGRYIHDIRPGEFISVIGKVRADLEEENMLEEMYQQFDPDVQEVANIVKGNM